MNPFRTTRTFSHPPETVFAALADSARLARWWGPAGFSNRFQTFEFREGGVWVFDMVGPDGTVYPNRSTFGRIVPDREVVIRHQNAPLFTLTITLVPEAGGTRVDWTQAFDDDAVARAVAAIVVPANEQNLDRWAVELG